MGIDWSVEAGMAPLCSVLLHILLIMYYELNVMHCLGTIIKSLRLVKKLLCHSAHIYWVPTIFQVNVIIAGSQGEW